MAIDIHQTDNKDVARMALAWEIVDRAMHYHAAKGESLSEVALDMTSKYNEVYNAILENERKDAPQLGLSVS